MKEIEGSVDERVVPQLLVVVGKTEYWVRIGRKRYIYWMDGALKYQLDTFHYNRHKGPWTWFTFLKRKAYKWKEVKL